MTALVPQKEAKYSLVRVPIPTKEKPTTHSTTNSCPCHRGRLVLELKKDRLTMQSLWRSLFAYHGRKAALSTPAYTPRARSALNWARNAANVPASSALRTSCIRFR